MNKRKNWIASLLCASFGALWFFIRGGGQYLGGDSAWGMMQGTGDWGQHILGFMFFRQAAWSFPLGSIPNLASPIGTTLGFVDANPIVGVLLKPFSAWLPIDFQYVGLILLACFILQGYFAYRVAKHVSEAIGIRILVALLLTMSPLLLWRIGHENLCAHFLILWALDVVLERNRKRSWEIALLCFVAIGTHMYFVPMVLGLGIGWIVLSTS